MTSKKGTKGPKATQSVQKVTKNSDIKLGDVFILGDHTLVCGDATDKRSYSLLEEKTVSLLLTDIPYGVAVVESKTGFLDNGSSHEPIANDHIQSDDEFRDFSTSWLTHIPPLLTRKNSYYIFNSDRMMFPLKEALDGNGFRLTQLLVWVKTSGVLGRLDYIPQHELIAYGWHGVHKFHKAQDKSVLVSPKTKKNDLHSTMKSVSILRRLILNSSRADDIVLDNFGGSGSTLLACEQTARKCYMVELIPEYIQVIIDRWEKLTGVKAIFSKNIYE